MGRKAGLGFEIYQKSKPVGGFEDYRSDGEKSADPPRRDLSGRYGNGRGLWRLSPAERTDQSGRVRKTAEKSEEDHE